MITLCSHLFWPRDASGVGFGERYSDCDRVLECMQRSLKIASVSNPNLFVDILDRFVCFCHILHILTFLRYIYYFEHENPAIHVRYLSGLIALINEQRDPEGTGVPGGTSAGVDAHYRNTLGIFDMFCFLSSF
jgi:hypothetical protein